MSYYHLGATNNVELQVAVDKAVASLRSACTQLIDELSSSAVAKVFVQSGIDSTKTLVQSINNALDGTVPRLLARVKAGDQAAADRMLALLQTMQATLLSHRQDLSELWAKTPAAARLLATILAGVDQVAFLVIDFFKNNINPRLPPGTGIGLSVVAGLVGLALLVKLFK